MIAIISTVSTPNINPNNPREFNIHTYNTMDLLGIAGYLCLTSSRILNVFIYNLNNVTFRNRVVKLLVNISHKLGFYCIIEKLRTTKTINKTTLVTKTGKTNVKSITTVPKKMLKWSLFTT